MHGKVQFYSKIFANEGSRIYFLLYFSGDKSPGVDANMQRKKKSIANTTIYFSVIAVLGQPSWVLTSEVTQEPIEKG